MTRLFAPLFAAFALITLPASAGVDAALDGHILPRMERFAGASVALAEAARADCTASALAPAYHTAFDAWMAVADLRMGPSEQAAPHIAFWPDTKGFTPRTLARFIAEADPRVDDPAAFSEASIAGRGFFALDMLLFDAGFSGYGHEEYACRLARAIATDLGREAEALHRAWRDDFAAVMRSAGAPDNATYLDEGEVARALYTQVLSGLEFTLNARIARPLGSFERPMPTRAEAWRSGRSLDHVVAATEAAVALAQALAGVDLPRTEAALAAVRAAAAQVTDPGFADIEDPAARLRLEVLGQRVAVVEAAIRDEVGAPLGLSAGFNSQDGD